MNPHVASLSQLLAPKVELTLGQTLILKIYSFVLWLIQPFYLLKLLWRSRTEPLYRHALLQRWGHYDPIDRGIDVPSRLWLHAVSLGETRAAAALVSALRQECPGLSLLLTHGTATGWQAGSEILQSGDAQAWLPLDTPGAVRRFLKQFRPFAGVLLETEVWPNLLHQCQEFGIPVLLANARLSERSLRKARRISCLIQPALKSLSWVLAQSEEDLVHFTKAGVQPQFIKVLGNIKFDMTPDPGQLSQGRSLKEQLSRPVILAVSTREGEETPLLQAWCSHLNGLDAAQTRPLLVLVPRHPQRFNEVARILEAQGLKFFRKSDTSFLQGLLNNLEMDVLLGDSIGELPFYYAMSDVALLGGSFAPLGGQNLIEAAACGCPVVMGPHTFNFRQAANWALAAGAAQQVADMNTGVRVAMAWSQTGHVTYAAHQAIDFAKKHRGASNRTAQQILHDLGQ